MGDWKRMGARPGLKDGIKGVYFAVWAPGARAVYLVGNFNAWNGNGYAMERQEPEGIYTCFIPGLGVGDAYMYEILTMDGRRLLKSDPYGNCAEFRPGRASIVADMDAFVWEDEDWMKRRREQDVYKMPLSIYEVHIGSWKKHSPAFEGDPGFYNYREFAEEIVPYVKEMGYTHVELMGIAEHPLDASWGYQVTGYFAPTSRYGAPQDFMYMINHLHQHGIGVILDWVPGHFPKDSHGLAEFDGTFLYEYSDEKKREHPQWGTYVFDYEKPQVREFLISSALFWIEDMHADGLRVDAVASMLYLDYGREYGRWDPNVRGENKNLEAEGFLRQLNAEVTGRNPGVMMIAEESTAWPGVTRSTEDGGLGFTFKWNMGWMHDFLDYMKLEPSFRRDNHNRMNFSLMYAYSEKFILVLSHDEVVHEKESMIRKMPGNWQERFAQLKTAYAFMIGHPGRKLSFMGQEFGQLREWSEERSLDWELLELKNHIWLRDFVKKLLHIYKNYPALYNQDNLQTGFTWINADDSGRSIFSFVRSAGKDGKQLLFICNFLPTARADYRVGVPKRGTYRLLLDSDSPEFGGMAAEDKLRSYEAEVMEWEGQPYSFSYPLGAYGAAVLEFE